MEAHYGRGIGSCPAAGMMAPELIAGKLDEVIKEAWNDLVAALLSLPCLPHADTMENNTGIF